MILKKVCSNIKNLLIYGLILFTAVYLLYGCQQQQEQAESTKYKNGIYIGFSDVGDSGYAWARINIQGNDITEVDLMEITSRGNRKNYDTYEYEPAIAAHKELPEQFAKKNSAEIDVYTGATDSSEKYKQAVRRALEIASGKQEEKFFDGKFQGSSTQSSQYGYAVAMVELEGDKIKDIKLKELTGEGEFKDFSNYDYEPAVKANKKMAERIIKANSTDVDTYTGATDSSRKYIHAVDNALLHASRDPGANNRREEDIEVDVNPSTK